MERPVSDSLIELSEITLKTFMDVTGENPDTDPKGIIGVLAAIGNNLYLASARDGAPGVPNVDEQLARLTLEAYVLPFSDQLVDVMEGEGIPRDSISPTLRIELSEEIAERVYSAGYRPTVKVYGAG